MPGAAQRFGVIVGRTCLARRCSGRGSDRRRASNVPAPFSGWWPEGKPTGLHWCGSNQSEKRRTLSARVCTVENPTNT
jgi:hypothetical protein